MKSPREKFMHELSDAYDAEHRFLQAMEEMRKEAKDSDLKQMIADHLSETKDHIKWVEEAYSIMGERPKRKACDGAKGIVTEGQKTVKEVEEQKLRDAVIDGALAKSEHYEIAGYRGLVTGARAMGKPDLARLFGRICSQEEEMAQRLEQAAPRLLERAGAAKAS